MSCQVLAPDVQPCVWMAAGLIRYWICDRDFDCEACPLDVALRDRGTHPYDPEHAHPSTLPVETPKDRLYAPGHTWVQPRWDKGEGTCRLGLDAFAAAIIGAVSCVHPHAPGRRLERTDTLCDLELDSGILHPRSPVRGRVVGCNPTLRAQPCRVVSQPYGDGWIVELAEVDPEELLSLSGPEAGRVHADGDLTVFRREVARRLLGEPIWEECAHDEDHAWTDLRSLFGTTAYLSLLRRFIH